MAGNTFGKYFKLTTFGESHGVAIGGIIDGCPAGVTLDLEAIQLELDRRKPGQSRLTTQRRESDTVEFLSGIFEGQTTGTPIGFVIKNEDQRSKDYSHIKDIYRPSHADFTYDKKYGVRDYRGGGRSSARETACRVVGGAVARQVLKGLEISAFVSAAGPVKLEKSYKELDLSKTYNSIVSCPDAEVEAEMITAIDGARKNGDSLGGIITCVVKHAPVGLGQPVFDRLHADLGKAMLSINAVKGFEIGSGFAAAEMHGSEHNDAFLPEGGTQTNFSGGVQGGISNGEDIYFRVAFKPVATIMRDQQTIDKDGNEAVAQGKGRHDPCVVPRAVPIVEAMTALVLVDHLLAARMDRI